MVGGEHLRIILPVIFLGALGGLSHAYAESLEWDQDMFMIEHSGIVTLNLDSDPGSHIQNVWVTLSINDVVQIGVPLERQSDTQFSSKHVKLTNSGNNVNQLHIPEEGGDVVFVTQVYDRSISSLSTSRIVNQTNLSLLADYDEDYKTNKAAFSVEQNICDELGGDRDNDGLCDVWETESGLVVFSSNNELINYTLPCSTNFYNDTSIGIDVCPNPDIPDIYFEIDWMVGHKPSKIALKQIVDAFRFSNYQTNGEETGIHAHIQLDEGILPHVNEIINPGTAGRPGTDALKKFWYGTLSEREGAIIPETWTGQKRDLKNQAFHYVLFAHDREGAVGTSGYSEYIGNDVMVTLGSWDGMVGSPDQQAGTLLHEIGHNIGLLHGGDEYYNCKPNYISVMSFSRQTSDLVERKVDLSQKRLNSLDENAEGNQTIGSYSDPEVEIVYSNSAGGIFNTTTSANSWNFGTPTKLNLFTPIGCGGANDGPLTSHFDYEDLDFVALTHANWIDGRSNPGFVEHTSGSNDLDSTITKVQLKSNPGDNLASPSIPPTVCVNFNSNYQGIIPNPAKDRICISDELTYKNSLYMRTVHFDGLKNEILKIPDGHFIIPSEASSYKKAYLLQLEKIRDKINQGNMREVIEETKIFQSWFDGEGTDEFIMDTTSRERIHQLSSKAINSQLKTIPEFDTLAVIVFSISIISVIALTSRSKFSMIGIGKSHI